MGKKFSGRQVALGVALEDPRGSVASPVFWIPKTDFSFDDRVEKFRVNSSIGTLEDSEQAHVLTKWGEGDVTGEVRDQAIGVFLSALLGNVNTTGPVDQAYTHVFSLDQSVSHPSMTFTVKDPNTTEAYALVMLQSIEFAHELSGLMTWSATFMGKTSKGSSATTDYTAESKFSKGDLKFKIAGTTSEIASSSPISIKNLTLTFTKNLSRDDSLGTAEPEDFNNTNIGVEGQIMLNYTDETYKEYMRSNSYRALSFLWTNKDRPIGSGSTYPSIEFEMPKVDFLDWEPNYALDEISTQTVTFKASRDLETNTDMVTVTLVNGHSGIAY